MAAKALPPKYKLVSEPEDELICLICLEVAEEPWQHGECGRLFCKTCLDKLGKDKPCPNCKKEQPQYFSDTRSEFTLSRYDINVTFILTFNRQKHNPSFTCALQQCREKL